uniref:Uncharacterized protein n=2 Tax=Oryza sativa subsp. japonica TaxID=39947 RepID=Q53KA1_ORYSJ|nr:hypothetical protein LOC_Os11g22360 [Oryza sativa Japonica Group]AAX95833.1 hypothetical protein [Oryza sativa Japonica Group]ABA93155.1 hypothetical protein LOC_Os11g22360 [Oryza sativa Japonica Group]
MGQVQASAAAMGAEVEAGASGGRRRSSGAWAAVGGAACGRVRSGADDGEVVVDGALDGDWRLQRDDGQGVLGLHTRHAAHVPTLRAATVASPLQSVALVTLGPSTPAPGARGGDNGGGGRKRKGVVAGPRPLRQGSAVRERRRWDTWTRSGSSGTACKRATACAASCSTVSRRLLIQANARELAATVIASASLLHATDKLAASRVALVPPLRLRLPRRGERTQLLPCRQVERIRGEERGGGGRNKRLTCGTHTESAATSDKTGVKTAKRPSLH